MRFLAQKVIQKTQIINYIYLIIKDLTKKT
jgi:hypothetical protein